MLKHSLSFFFVVCFSLNANAQKKTALWLDEMPIKSFSQGIPAVVSKTNQGGGPIAIAGKKFSRGIGVASTSILAFQLDGNAISFRAHVGVDDEGSQTILHRFYVLGDRKILFESGDMRRGDKAKEVKVDLRGVRRLGLLVLVNDENQNRVFTNWADARFVMKGNSQPGHIPNNGDRYLLTPKPSLIPKINGPAVFGARPGNPFLYTVVASGQKPVKFYAEGLPAGLVLDSLSGQITGVVKEKKDFKVWITATNVHGSSHRELTIRIGETIALTPPMGWNGWNSWSRNIDREKVLASANAMVEKGLKDYGWTYVNIDDAWQGVRSGPDHALQANAKFPEFKSMIDSIHRLGLKLGVYSTPMITSYAGYPGGSSIFPDGAFPDSIVANKRAYRYRGPYSFEKADARQFAAWGVDYLKYDWKIEKESARRMSEALETVDRDIVYSISNSAPFALADEWQKLANLWRTGPDIRDSWHGLYKTTFTLDKWAPFSKPGHWNDPDMMILGNVTTGSEMHPSRLTPDEQYSHVSLFALLSAPMLVGCPIDQLDLFTLNLLTNDEVIAIDQDPVGKSARLVAEENGVQVWLKPLADGNYAVGLFNTAAYGKDPQTYFRWGDEPAANFRFDPLRLGLQGRWNLRDIWQQKDLNVPSGTTDLLIPHHGVKLLKLTRSIPADTVFLDKLPIQSFSEGIRPVATGTNYQKDSMRIAGTYFNRGIGLQSVSVLPFQLNGKGLRMHAKVGADDMGNKAIPIRFYVLGDGKVLYQSKPMSVGDPAEIIDIDLQGIQKLGLLVTDEVKGISNKRTYGNWADAMLVMEEGTMPLQVPNEIEKYIQTPVAANTPRINSATVYGARPGHPFLFAIAASGKRPMQFDASGLPAGLKLDRQTGIITGNVAKSGHYRVKLTASNTHGSVKQELHIRIGDTIALTPPIGWNGWNSWAHQIDREKVMASARAMVSSGLSNFGWSYINIDDTWQGVRSGKDFALQPNEKFRDFKSMVDTIHGMGLKVGLYSTPYISTYAGYPGGSSDYPSGGETHALISKNRQPFMRIAANRFEEADAKQMASWGIDFLKYDWRIDVNSTERMAKALRHSGRDILLSISNSAPFEKAADWVRTTQMFRTGPDIRDSWNSLYTTTFSLDKWYPYTGPGHWPDPDMMIVGNVSTGAGLHPTRLTADEQYSHVSLYALLAAPMLIGCPIESLDSFTLNLLTNAEVIAINQDPLGKGGRMVLEEHGIQVWLKQLEDGSYGLGLFNTAEYGKTPASYFRWGNEGSRHFSLDLSRVGLNGTWRIRDAWIQQDVEHHSGMISASIPHHGVKLFRIYPTRSPKENFIIPQVASPARRKEILNSQWQGLQKNIPTTSVRDCFLFLLDALDTRSFTDEQLIRTIEQVKTRVITDSTKPSFGNMYWGWTETGGDVGDGNNVEFCVQYGILIKILFNDRLTNASRAALDDLFMKALVGVRRQPVRISYTNIYLMRVWNLIALGETYQLPVVVEEGRKAFDIWLKHVANYGNREYDSPTYSGVDLESLLLLSRFTSDVAIRQKAKDALQFFLTDIAAHYNEQGGYLAGAHSRDYNRVFGKDLLEARYMNPLLGGDNRNDQLFHQVCFSILKARGLDTEQLKLMRKNDKFILQRWDSLGHTYAFDYHGKKFSIGSSNQYYSPDDKSFIVYLHSPRIPAMPNIVYVSEGRDDHYGTWGSTGMGEKMKHLMPRGYPANGGWNKTRHLMPFQQVVQNRNEFVMLVSGDKDHNAIRDYLNSTIILPDYFDELWMGDSRINKPAVGQHVAMNSTNTFFARFEDVAIAIRVLWDNAAGNRFALHNDGFRFASNREDFKLKHNAALRLTLQHPEGKKLGIAMWWKVQEGIKGDQDFAAFRGQVLGSAVDLALTNGIIDVAVQTQAGKLGLKADLNKKQRLAYYNPFRMPEDFLFQVDGKEIDKKFKYIYR